MSNMPRLMDHWLGFYIAGGYIRSKDSVNYIIDSFIACFTIKPDLNLSCLYYRVNIARWVIHSR